MLGTIKPMVKKTHRVYNFTAIFEPAEEGGYTVTIPVLPGCISEGNTFEEALENIKEAAALYLEDLDETNEPLPHEREAIVSSVSVSVKRP